MENTKKRRQREIEDIVQELPDNEQNKKEHTTVEGQLNDKLAPDLKLVEPTERVASMAKTVPAAVTEAARVDYRTMMGHACRRCINVRTGVHLVPKQCVYKMKGDRIGMFYCDYCGMERHIVEKLKFTGKWTVFTGKMK